MAMEGEGPRAWPAPGAQGTSKDCPVRSCPRFAAPGELVLAVTRARTRRTQSLFPPPSHSNRKGNTGVSHWGPERVCGGGGGGWAWTWSQSCVGSLPWGHETGGDTNILIHLSGAFGVSVQSPVPNTMSLPRSSGTALLRFAETNKPKQRLGFLFARPSLPSA